MMGDPEGPQHDHVMARMEVHDPNHPGIVHDVTIQVEDPDDAIQPVAELVGFDDIIVREESEEETPPPLDTP